MSEKSQSGKEEMSEMSGEDGETIAPWMLRILVFLNPESILFRVPLLVLICLLTFGSYYCYDTPAALQPRFEADFDIGPLAFGALYSVYSWPNVILCLFGGWLIDRIGLRYMSIVFCALVGSGAALFAVGATVQGLPGYGIALAGRVLFGLGGESLSVAQSTYCAKWFKGKEFAFAFGITLSTSRIGSAVNLNLSPVLAEYFNGIVGASWAGAILCVVSLTAGLILSFYDWAGEKVLRVTRNPRAEEFRADPDDKISLLDIRYFPLTVWILYFICDMFYISIFEFIAFGHNYLDLSYGFQTCVKEHKCVDHKLWGFLQAANLLSIPYFVSTIGSPLFGAVADFVGYSGVWIILGSFGQTCALIYVSFPIVEGEMWYPLPALVVMGFMYSLLAAGLWPSVAYVVETRRLGTAYGLMTALQNFGLAVAPLAMGGVLDLTEKYMSDKNAYKVGFLILAGCAASAFAAALLLSFVDLIKGRRINCSRLERERRSKEYAAELADRAELRRENSRQAEVSTILRDEDSYTS